MYAGSLSGIWLCDSMDCNPPGSFFPCDFPDKNTGAGCHFLLQRIFPTRGWNSCLLYCRQTLYLLSHQGNPKRRVDEIHFKKLGVLFNLCFGFSWFSSRSLYFEGLLTWNTGILAGEGGWICQQWGRFFNIRGVNQVSRTVKYHGSQVY